MNSLLKSKALPIYGLIILVACLRLLPHPVNFAPIGALGLFSGALISGRFTWCLPVFALILGDIIIGLYDPLVMLSVYLSFALSAVIGRLVLSEKRNSVRIGVCAVSTASILFILSNFAVWLTGMHYEMTAAGLLECFTLAIPFYGNSLLGDLFYTFAMFACYEIAVQFMSSNKERQAI